MKYTLSFSLKLERSGSLVIYNSKTFAEKPIIISIPEIVKLVECFIENFEEVGITEKLDKGITKKLDNLKGLSGTAYICESKELDQDILDKFCVKLTEYLQKCCSNISKHGLLSEQINLDISGLAEVIEIRNYLAKYTNSDKKSYEDGYLYIML